MFSFYIDTADINYITKLIDNKNFPKLNCLGITTNPNAMDKIGATSLKQWINHIVSLDFFLKEKFGKHSQLHIQIPNSAMSLSEIKKFVQYIYKECNPLCKIVFKMPPRLDILTNKSSLDISINITGLADSKSCLGMLGLGADYVSIIPGRMEQAGINCSMHQLDLMRNRSALMGKVISGSMRTVYGVIESVNYNTIPTIGTRVWDQLLQDESLFKTLFTNDLSSKPTDQTNELSKQFFYDMDNLSNQVYNDFKCV